MKNKFLIIGAGKLGSYIANSLSVNGFDVIIIDKDKEKIEYLPLTYSGLTCVGDATLVDTLENNGIATCKCIICLTDDDNTNIFVSHLAKVFFEAPNIFIRLNDPKKNILVDSLGIKTISPFISGIEQIDKLIKGIN